MAWSGAAALLLLLYCCETFGNPHESNDERKLFGGYRIVPKACRPEEATDKDELGICMFNYECAARSGEVVGACMDGFLFGACCRLPAGHTFELPDPELLLEGAVATFPPENPNAIVATSKKPDTMGSSSISEFLHNPQHHVSVHPEADTVLLDHSSSTTNRPKNHSELSTFSYVENNNVEDQASTPKNHPEEKSTVSATSTLYSSGNKWSTRPWPPPTTSYLPISSSSEYEEGLVLVPTITLSSNKHPESDPEPSPEPGGPDPQSINHIISLLNDTKGGLVDPGPEPEPEIISLGISPAPALSTWVSVNGPSSASTSWKPETTSFTKDPIFTSSHHVIGPAYNVFTTEHQPSRPVPTVIVLSPVTTDTTTKASTTKIPSTIASTTKLSTTAISLITKRPSSNKPPSGFFITKRPSSTPPTQITSRPTLYTERPNFVTTQYTSRPTFTSLYTTSHFDHSTIHHDRPSSEYDRPTTHFDRPSSEYDRPTTHYDRPTSQYDRPSSEYDRPTSQYDRPSSEHDRPTTHYDRPASQYDHPTSQSERPITQYDHPTTQFVYRPPISTIKPGTTYYTYRPTTFSTQNAESSFSQVTNRPSTGTIYLTNRPTSTFRPTSGTSIVSNKPWTTTPIDYPETTLPADHLANFPPVRNPSFNMTQHERPPVVLPPNPEDLFNADDIPTPEFLEDEKLDNKLQGFVDKIVQSLEGNFDDLEDILINGPNETLSSSTTSTTRRPQRPTVTTSRPTRRPTPTGSRPSSSVRPQVTRPIQTARPRPTSRPSTIRPFQTSSKPTSGPSHATSRPTLTSRPSLTIRPINTQSTKPTRPRPTRITTTLRPVSTNKATTTKRSTTTSYTTQLLVQQDDSVKPSKSSTTSEAPATTLPDEPTTAPTTDESTIHSKPDYKHECGVRPLVQKSGRIVGGKSSTFGEWPWQVLVRESTWLGLFTKNKCGGVLITSRYVITAAHCQPGFLANLVAVFGEFDISGELESRRSVTKNVRRVIVHRQYDAATFANDIALLELDSPVAFDEHIVPICMPKSKEDFKGRVATVTGWGRLKYGGGVPNLLQEVQVPVIDNDVCQEMFHTAGHSKVILISFLCAGYANGQKDSCEGDSGGPLMMEREDGHWVLIGTVSHGIKCAAPYLPGVYMRTTYYKPWLHSITGVN